MPYDAKDPRASLAGVSKDSPKSATDFASAEYVKFYEIEPSETSAGVRTWYGCGQNFILAYTEASAGVELTRDQQPDEYVLLLPDHTMSVDITTDHESEGVSGYSISFIPPGESSVRVLSEGRLIRLFTVRSEDLAAKCSNAASYATPHPNMAPYEPWPDPLGGYRLRSYSLDVPPQEGRFGRIWRCSTFMVNYLDPSNGPRDVTKMSPHSHDDFEQCSLSLAGQFVHHIRWPWITDMNKWREDEHELCETPSMAVIPARAIHTTAAVDKGINQLVDIFCPPRIDFSEKSGWVLNADEYPVP